MFVPYRDVSIIHRAESQQVPETGVPGNLLSVQQIMDTLMQIPERSDVEFTGGDMFRHPDFPRIAEFAARRFHRVKYNTSGAIFADNVFADRAIRNSVKIICQTVPPERLASFLAMDAARPEVRGFLNLAVLARRNTGTERVYHHYLQREFCFMVRLMPDYGSLEFLAGASESVSKEQIARIIVDARGLAKIDDKALAAIHAAVEGSVRNGTWILTRGLPLCIMPGIEEHAEEIYRTQQRIPGYRHIAGICDECTLARPCCGPPVQSTAGMELRPVSCADTARLQDLANLHEYAGWPGRGERG